MIDCGSGPREMTATKLSCGSMDHPIPDVPVTITILVVSVAVVFTVWVPVIMYRSAIRHGRSTSESLRLGCALVAVFAVWFGLSAGYTQVEAFHDGPDRPPWLVYLFFALIVIGPIGVARSSSLDELLADRRTLAELLITQTARWLGCVFLVLEVGGQLPASSPTQPRSATSQSVSLPASP